MELTNDQYTGLGTLLNWYDRYDHQFIEISGIVGTGSWDLIQEFIELSPLDPKEVMYLTHDQKHMLELAYRKYHAYYLPRIIYNYRCFTDHDTIPVINYRSKVAVSTWKKETRSKVDPLYKLIVVFDSTLLSLQTIMDIGTFGLPVILVRDPMLLPAPDSYLFTREPNITLRETSDKHMGDPIVHFAKKVLHGERPEYGSYDNVSVIPKKQLNPHNFRSSDMIVTISEELRSQVNQTYREKIRKLRGTINVAGERIIVTEPLYRQQLRNSDNKKVRLYVTRGMVGTLSRVNKHAPGTRYVTVDMKPDGYHESFTALPLDRYYLNGITADSRQLVPEEPLICQYAYALSSPLSRTSHWDKVTVILEDDTTDDQEINRRLAYTALTRANRSMTIIL